jgi:hypothetical protein
MQLEKPIFLKHYIIVNGNESDWIELTYLENKMKGKKVKGIQLEELPMLRFQIDPHPNSYRHQVFGKAYGEWRTEIAGQMEKVPITIKEATVYYSEGQPEKVPIGEINVLWDQRESVLQMSSSRGSSDGTGQHSVTVKQPLTLEQVDYSFSDRLSSKFELTMEGRDITPQLPIRLAAGDPLTFNYKWTIPVRIHLLPSRCIKHTFCLPSRPRTEERFTIDFLPISIFTCTRSKSSGWYVLEVISLEPFHAKCIKETRLGACISSR